MNNVIKAFKSRTKHRSYNYSSNILKQNFSRNFCIKYIPTKKLKFENLEGMKCSVIYDADKINVKNDSLNRKNNTKSTIPFKKLYYGSILVSVGMLSTLGLFQASYLPYLINTCVQPLIILNYSKKLQHLSSAVSSLYLVKNGHQILLITKDSSVHLINIKEIIRLEESYKSQSLRFELETLDKKFNFSFKNDESYLNEDIISAIKDRNFIDTNSSLMNYNRFTFPKLESNIKRLLKKEYLDFNIPYRYLIDKRRFLTNLWTRTNNLSKLPGLNTVMNMSQYYGKVSKESLKQDKRKIVFNDIFSQQRKEYKGSLYKLVKESKLGLYSKKRFERKFNIDIYSFIKNYHDTTKDLNEREQYYNEVMLHSKTFGRRVKKTTKSIKAN